MTKVVLLAGGKGSRLNDVNPKPLVRLGEIPMVQHVMNSYNHFGYDEFILATGHRHEDFEEYFNNIDLPYVVRLINTGENANTGERIQRLRFEIGAYPFCLSYSDGLSDVNLADVEHCFYADKSSPDLLITAVHPPERYGLMVLEEGEGKTSPIKTFNEKPQRDDWINGGFMVCSPNIFDYIEKDDSFEGDCIPRIVLHQKMVGYKHLGNWGSIDTQKDLNLFMDLWNTGKAFWTNGGNNL